MAREVAAIVAVAVLAGAALPRAAQADGDPASDVLLGQSTFLPSDAGATPAEQDRLQGTVSAAARSGYPIRLAVIASPADLGSVTELWRHPLQYAPFLDQELSLVYKGPVLVVMPNGVGLASANRLSPAERAVAGDRHLISSAQLAAVAQSAVEKLAAAAGHPIANAQLAAISASRSAGPSPSSTGPIAYLVLALGAMLIALAWAASLRARPLRRRTSSTPLT